MDMSYNWGPYFIVPSAVLKTYSGKVLLRDHFDEDLLAKELGELGLEGYPRAAVNPWYFRKKNSQTWIKIGESWRQKDNFSVLWDTGKLNNGEYDVLGLMHVVIKKGDGEVVIARENMVTIDIQN
jgi:hypothetical protein